MMKSFFKKSSVTPKGERIQYRAMESGGENLKYIKQECVRKIEENTKHPIPHCMWAINAAFYLGYQAGQEKVKERIASHFGEGGGRS